jgi:hypothetical protein
MNNKFLFLTLTLITTILFFSCSDIDKPIETEPTNNKTLFILSEGDFNKNNSTLAKFDIETGNVIKEYFREVNKRKLGAVGNDMLQYGSKLYIVMNVSETIEVVDAATGISIRQISMKSDNGGNRQPRQIAAHGGKVYITSYDDTVTRIDTVTFEKDAIVEVGMDPDGIEISNNKIFVANSGGLNYLNGYNNTLSIIDITNFTVEKEIEVGVNPTYLGKDSRGNVYLSSLGEYGKNNGMFQKISSNGEVTIIDGISSPDKFVIFENKAYIIHVNYESSYSVLVYDCLTDQIVTDNFVTDDTEIGIIHSIDVDEKTGDIFIMESDYITPGTVYCFDNKGELKYKIPLVGLNPTVIVGI